MDTNVDPVAEDFCKTLEVKGAVPQPEHIINTELFYNSRAKVHPEKDQAPPHAEQNGIPNSMFMAQTSRGLIEIFCLVT